MGLEALGQKVMLEAYGLRADTSKTHGGWFGHVLGDNRGGIVNGLRPRNQ